MWSQKIILMSIVKSALWLFLCNAAASGSCAQKQTLFQIKHPLWILFGGIWCNIAKILCFALTDLQWRHRVVLHRLYLHVSHPYPTPVPRRRILPLSTSRFHHQSVMAYRLFQLAEEAFHPFQTFQAFRPAFQLPTTTIFTKMLVAWNTSFSSPPFHHSTFHWHNLTKIQCMAYWTPW